MDRALLASVGDAGEPSPTHWAQQTSTEEALTLSRRSSGCPNILDHISPDRLGNYVNILCGPLHPPPQGHTAASDYHDARRITFFGKMSPHG